MLKENDLKQIKDEKLREAVRLELRRQERRRKLLLFLTLGIAVCCLGYFFVYSYMEKRTQNRNDQLSGLKEYSSQLSKENATEEEKQEVVVHKTGETVIPDILPEYKVLYSNNKSLIGWIKIADTNIDYPVMQTENNTYYLDHDFDQNYDKNGCIFMDADCDVINRSTNLILYGHHMKSGAMFGKLDAYADRSFYEEHPTFQFDTIYEKGQYRIAYVFRSEVYDENEVTFKYYQFIQANSEAEFNSNMLQMAQMSLYDTGITPAYGDELVTLSTCDHTETQEGRFVVVGVKIQ